MKKNDRFAKTIVFCVDKEHADEMRRALNNLNDDLAKKYSDYVCRITSDEGSVGKGYLSKFQELETTTPAIITTSQLLTFRSRYSNLQKYRDCTRGQLDGGVQTNHRPGNASERRLRQYYFNIFDYTGSATRLFADADFDGEPVFVTEQEMTEAGETVAEVTTEQTAVAESEEDSEPTIANDSQGIRRKYYFDGSQSRSPPI